MEKLDDLKQRINDLDQEKVAEFAKEKISNIKDLSKDCTENVYLCDNLPNQYLVKENSQFIIKNNN